MATHASGRFTGRSRRGATSGTSGDARCRSSRCIYMSWHTAGRAVQNGDSAASLWAAVRGAEVRQCDAGLVTLQRTHTARNDCCQTAGRQQDHRTGHEPACSQHRERREALERGGLGMIAHVVRFVLGGVYVAYPTVPYRTCPHSSSATSMPPTPRARRPWTGGRGWE